jgi:hypothetical protein
MLMAGKKESLPAHLLPDLLAELWDLVYGRRELRGSIQIERRGSA